MTEKEADLDRVVEELDEMKAYENQRKYDIETIQSQYRTNLKRDYNRMDKFLEDKQLNAKAIEIEAQSILNNMFGKLKSSKVLKQEMEDLEE